MVFLYSVSGACFICNEKFDFVSTNEENQRRITSFKMLLRYLGVDLLKYFPSGVNLCEWCSSRLNGFWQLYQEFENLRLCMDDFVQIFHDRMKTISENSRSDDPSQNDDNPTINQLRDIILKKCALKVHSIPLIKLARAVVPQILENNTTFDNIPSPLVESVYHPIKREEVNDDIDDSHEDYFSDSAHDEKPSPREKEPSSPKRVKIQILKSKIPLQNEKNSTNSLTHTCPTCQKIFQNFKTYLLHKISHKTIEKVKTKRVKKHYNKCDFCEKVCSGKTVFEMHNAAQHLMEFHSSKIPPGTTKAELEKATKILLSKKKLYPSKNAGCPFCSRLFNGNTKVKYHLQIHHFDKVLLALKNPGDDSLHKAHVHHYRLKRNHEHIVISGNFASFKYNEISGDKPFQCCNCENSYSKLAELKSHALRKHTMAYLSDKFPSGTTQEDLETCVDSLLRNDKTKTQLEEKWNCFVCSAGFEVKSRLQYHLMSLHMDEIIQKISHPPKSPHATTDEKILPEKKPQAKLYICPTCQRVFRKYKLFLVHKRNHKYKKPLKKCNYCKKVFTPSALPFHNMSKHLMKFHSSRIPRGVTEPKLQEATKLILDKKKTHTDKIGKCPFCWKRFQQEYSLRCHLQIHHFDKVLLALENPDDPSLEEGECSDKSVYLGAANPTRRFENLKVKPNSKRPFQCTLCEKSFIQRDAFNTHSINIHPLLYFKNELPPGTTQYELDVAVSSVLREGKPRNRNSGEKWRCSICSKEFIMRGVLRLHLLKYHLNNIIHNLKKVEPVDLAAVSGNCRNKNDFKCWSCEDFYGSRGGLRIHRKLKHLGTLECCYCQRGSKDERILISHVMMCHTFQFFKHKLDPKTTENELTRVINEVVSEGVIKENNKAHVGCPLCFNEFHCQNLKAHLISDHFSYVVSLITPK